MVLAGGNARCSVGVPAPITNGVRVRLMMGVGGGRLAAQWLPGQVVAVAGVLSPYSVLRYGMDLK